MNNKDLQSKLAAATSLENLKEILEGYEYNDYCDLEIPKFGGSDKIPADENSFCSEVAGDNGLDSDNADNAIPISWDTDDVLFYMDKGLEWGSREFFANLHGGVLCPFCKEMVNEFDTCPHLVCLEEHTNFELIWFNEYAEKSFKRALMDRLPNIEDEYDRERIEEGIERNEVFWGGGRTR